MQSFMLSKEILSLEPKLTYLDDFMIELEKTIVVFEIS